MFRYFIYILLLLNLNYTVFTYNIDDYILFDKAKETYFLHENTKAEIEFDKYMRVFPNSFPLTSEYANFFIGMNYYQLNNLDKGIFFLEKAVYIPNDFYEKNRRKSNFFQYQRDFFLGQLYLKKQNFSKAEEHYKNLILDYYSQPLEFYEKKALKILADFNPYYNLIYEIKYENNLSQLDKISNEDLEKIGNFFITKKDFKHSELIYEHLLKKSKIQNNTLYYKYFLSLFEEKKYSSIIKQTSGMKLDNGLFFIRGKSFEALKDYSRALYNFSEIKYGIYYNSAIISKANIFYLLGQYKDVILLLNPLSSRDFDLDVLLINSYINLKNKKLFLEKSKIFITKYPYTYESGIYSLISDRLKSKIENPWSISDYHSFYLINLIVNNYTTNLPPYKKLSNSEQYNAQIDGLFQIASLKDSQLLSLAIENSRFSNSDNNINKEIVITKLFEAGEFYNLALKNSENFKNNFYKYSDLIFFLFPKYYEDLINKVSKKYDVPKNIIYATILTYSKFNSGYISPSHEVGLLKIPLNLYNIKILTDPEKNLEIGMKKMSEIYKKNNSNNLKTLLEYSIDSENFSTLIFNYDGDLDLDKVQNLDLRKNIQQLMYNYTFYNSLYK
ncbi:transglycosylase SLT domain-containing protein [Cetobacterium sp. 2A]|uniref:transglycosylase SLT domain-containing protein n=1 Tax=Cetobacterium sp. 2A TaxID=2754723 RepID=UPI00163C8B5C|nr:transglycosylase SLT domain-containing protein [Cetobacterium sp. 2A]MBC2855791.1 transglycosylase SLT domain-containing protein [Cetobacterium sp. 2A]